MGTWTVAQGVATLALWSVLRPRTGNVLTTETRLRFSFDYPSQLMPLLVAFRELLEPELQFARRSVSAGARVIDVGASIGTWTIALASAGAHVTAFEPDPQNVRTLNANVLANALSGRVDVRAIALGLSAGMVQLTSGDRSYVTRVTTSPDGGVGRGGTPMNSLDNLSEEEGWESIDLLKVNTAGGESSVLGGATRVFRERRVKIAAVLDGIEVRDNLAAIRDCGYRLGFFDARGSVFVEVRRVVDLDALRPGPLNRYVLAVRSDVGA